MPLPMSSRLINPIFGRGKKRLPRHLIEDSRGAKFDLSFAKDRAALLCSCDRDEALVALSLREDYSTIGQSIECMILAHGHVATRVVLCASLANEDVSGLTSLSSKDLYAEAFAMGFASVLGATYTFLVCHNSLEFYLSNNLLNEDLCKLLAVTIQLAIALSSLLVEDQHLVALHEGRYYLTHYLSTVYYRSTYGY